MWLRSFYEGILSIAQREIFKLTEQFLSVIKRITQSFFRYWNGLAKKYCVQMVCLFNNIRMNLRLKKNVTISWLKLRKFARQILGKHRMRFIFLLYHSLTYSYIKTRSKDLLFHPVHFDRCDVIMHVERGMANILLTNWGINMNHFKARIRSRLRVG